MTIKLKASFLCPQCRKSIDATVYRFIKKQETPELIEKIHTGELFTFECQKCKEDIFVQYPILYYDVDKAILVNLLDKKNNYKDDDDLFSKYIKLLQRENVIIRAVKSIKDFCEKINIFNTKYNDITIELIKYTVLNNLLRDRFIGKELFFSEIKSNNSRELSFAVLNKGNSEHDNDYDGTGFNFPENTAIQMQHYINSIFQDKNNFDSYIVNQNTISTLLRQGKIKI
jgi:hypothetical protein